MNHKVSNVNKVTEMAGMHAEVYVLTVRIDNSVSQFLLALNYFD
jgi:hypothetical protein